MASTHRTGLDFPQTPDRGRQRHRRRAETAAATLFAGASLTAFLVLAASVAGAMVVYTQYH